MDYDNRDYMANALYHWVTESTKSHMLHGKTIETHIRDLLKEQPLTTGGSEMGAMAAPYLTPLPPRKKKTRKVIMEKGRRKRTKPTERIRC